MHSIAFAFDGHVLWQVPEREKKIYNKVLTNIRLDLMKNYSKKEKYILHNVDKIKPNNQL